MALDDIRAVLADVEFADWRFNVWEEDGRPILQVAFEAEDTDTGEWAEQKGRKWFLSPHMTNSEVVSTALKAVLTAMEHEVRELFTYRGRPVYGPHLDIEALWIVAGARDQREAA